MIKQNGNGKSGAKIAGMTARVSCFPDGMSAGNVAMVTPRNQVLGRNMFKEVIQVKKVVSVLLAAGIIATTGAFAENVGVSSPAASPVASPVAGAVSSIIDFADGNFGFLGMDTTLGNADASELSIVDYNGGKALRVSPAAAGRVPYVSLNVEGLLGENLSRLAKITFDVGVELGTDGKFYAQSGKVYMVNGEDSSKQSADWSVYMERKNPKTAVVTVPAGAFVAGRGDTLQFSKEVDSFIDSKKFDGEAPRDFYVTNIQFFDAEGNVLPVDTTAEWVAPVTEEDRSYLYDVANAVEFPNFAYEGGGWSQNGAEMPQEFLDALVPGSVIEISYESEDGTMWIVLPDAAAGWSRVANDGSAAINSSKNTCQITYEQIAAVCGEDKSTWGARLQCEAGSAWKVYSVKVGQKAPARSQRPLLPLMDSPAKAARGLRMASTSRKMCWMRSYPVRRCRLTLNPRTARCGLSCRTARRAGCVWRRARRASPAARRTSPMSRLSKPAARIRLAGARGCSAKQKARGRSTRCPW